MSDRNYTPSSLPRDRERFAELSDLLSDIDQSPTVASHQPVEIAQEGGLFVKEGGLFEKAGGPFEKAGGSFEKEDGLFENVFANVDTNYPLRPREVTLATPSAARSWQATPGSFSRATPVAVPLAPGPFDNWDMRPAAGTNAQILAETWFPDSGDNKAPAISMPEPNFSPELSDEEAFQSVLEGLEGDLFGDEELAALTEPASATLETGTSGLIDQESPGKYSHFEPEQLPDAETTWAAGPVTDYEAVFEDAIFDEIAPVSTPQSSAYDISVPELEDFSANFANNTQARPSLDTIVPVAVMASGIAVAARANASREMSAEYTNIPASTLPAAASFAPNLTPAFTEMASPYDEVPVTGSLIVPEFVTAEPVDAQNNTDFDDFDIRDFEAPSPAPRSQFSPQPQQIMVHEPSQKPSAENVVDELNDVNFDNVFDQDFNPTDELANVVGANVDDNEFVSDFRDDEIAPIPVMPPVVNARAGRVKWLALGALGLALVGGLAVYGSIGDSGIDSGEAPAIVRADNEPVRVLPVDPEGTIVPNQDRVVFDKVGGGNVVPEQQQETLVDGRQEPAIASTPVKEEDRVLTGDNSAEGNVGNGTAIAPRAVQTVTVRPDGTLVANQPVEQPAASQAEVVPETRPEGTPEPAVPQPMPQLPIAEAAIEAVPEKAVPPANEAAEANVPVRVVELKPVVQKQKTSTPKALDAVPSRPSDQPVNIVNNEAPAVPEQPADQQSAAVEPASTPAAGSYLMQIASTPTEESATATLRSLSGKFGSVLAGKDYVIQKADVPGKGTVYRVRIVAGSKDAAAKLCSSYKSAGGSCFVTR